MQPAPEIFAPFFIEARGARLRAARFAPDPAVPARGICVLLNGQTEFIEKYFEVIDELRGRGFAVATMDWRGQGGSARALQDDSRKGYVRDFAEYDEDLAALMDQVVAPMCPLARKSAPGGDIMPAVGMLIAVAHSMGGHNLLRTLARKPQSFTAALLSAPMIAVSFRGVAPWLVRLVTGVQTWRGNGVGWVWGMAARDPHIVTFETQSVTSDRARFARTQAFLRTHPQLRLAGATWNWLAAAMRSMAWLKTQAPQITTPLLVIAAGADRIVLTPQIRAFTALLPQARYVEIAGAGHEILMERDVLRAQWWQAFDTFFASREESP